MRVYHISEDQIKELIKSIDEAPAIGAVGDGLTYAVETVEEWKNKMGKFSVEVVDGERMTIEEKVQIYDELISAIFHEKSSYEKLMIEYENSEPGTDMNKLQSYQTYMICADNLEILYKLIYNGVKLK